jgi:hypothetical protein
MASPPSVPWPSRSFLSVSELDTDGLVKLTLTDFGSLGVEASDGKLYLPVELRRRARDGSVEVQERALLTIPTVEQKLRARMESRAYGQKEWKLDAERDAQQYSDLENYAILSFALRDVKSKGQLVAGGLVELIRTYSDATLTECWGTLNQWTELNDPRFGELAHDQLWKVISALAAGNLLPLVHMPTYAQSTCFALMAREACSSPNAPSWARSPETSSSAPSTETSSGGASADAIPAADPAAEA